MASLLGYYRFGEFGQRVAFGGKYEKTVISMNPDAQFHRRIGRLLGK